MPRAPWRRAATVRFVRFVRVGPSTWEAESADDPGAGPSHAWAWFEGPSLDIHVLEIAERGIYRVSRYERGISRAGVMDPKFTRIRDVATLRCATGSLLPASA